MPLTHFFRKSAGPGFDVLVLICVFEKNHFVYQRLSVAIQCMLKLLKGISVPNRQNKVRLIFGKNELGAFSESLRPPLSIAGPIMDFAGL